MHAYDKEGAGFQTPPRVLQEAKGIVKAIDVLGRYVKPSMGCTEPIAVALAAATAKRAIGGEVMRIEIVVDSQIFRNGLAVGVPGAQGQPGTHIAAALGALGGDPDLGLEVLQTAALEDLEEAQSLLAANQVSVTMDQQLQGPHVDAKVHTTHGWGRAVIEGSHTHVSLVEANGERLHESSATRTRSDPAHTAGEIGNWLRGASVSDLISCAEDSDQAALDYARQGIHANQQAADEGLRQAPGLGAGARLEQLARSCPRDIGLRAQSLAAAAVDARMAGLRVQVMTSSGSGNQGIVATLPAATVARLLDLDETRLAIAVVLSHLLLARVAEELGVLTPLCGSAAQAAAAASGAIVWLLGGSHPQVEHAASVTLGTQAGILCDGAKPACALKAALGSDVAVKVALLTMDGMPVGGGSGLVGPSLGETIKDIALIAADFQNASQHVLQAIARNVR